LPLLVGKSNRRMIDEPQLFRPRRFSLRRLHVLSFH